MSKICKKRVHGNEKINLPCAFKKCPGSLHFTLLMEDAFVLAEGTIETLAGGAPRILFITKKGSNKHLEFLEKRLLYFAESWLCNIKGRY